MYDIYLYTYCIPKNVPSIDLKRRKKIGAQYFLDSFLILGACFIENLNTIAAASVRSSCNYFGTQYNQNMKKKNKITHMNVKS